jgi:hypothetical protein
MQPLPFAGWAGGARALAPEVFARRDREVARMLDLLLGYFTPRTVFLEAGAPDCELAARAAGFVERVWCVDTAEGAAPGRRAPCNLRLARLDTLEAHSVDIAFAHDLEHGKGLFRVLKAGGILISNGSRKRLKACGFHFGLSAFMPGRPIVARK